MLFRRKYLVRPSVPTFDPVLGLAVLAIGVVSYALLVSKRAGERRIWQQMIRRVTGQD